MEGALETRDFDELARLAHWLKGAGGTVGFDAFTEPARELEQHVQAKSADKSKEAIAVLQALFARIVS
jgi:HPt (histidine-containing phosphotransfer) domain-containing protein